MNRITVVGFLAAALLVAQPLGARHATAQGALVHLRIAYVPFEGAAQVLYAQEEGFFAKEGVSVELQPISTAAAIASAVASGGVDIGFSAITTVAIAHSKGVPLLLVAAGPLAVAPNAPQSGGLIVAATSAIRGAKDLDGKTLCAAGLATLTEFAPRAWIDANAGDSSTVKFIEVPYSAMHEAVASGRCAAGYLTEPFYTPAKRDTRTLAWTLDAISKDYLGGGWVATAVWTRDHADVVSRFGAAMRDAANWANRQPPAIVGILVKYTGGDPATIASEVRDVFAEQLTPELVQPSIDVAARYMRFPAFPATALVVSP
jgi:NitT/TauT family transport system substrate-binding protein